MYLKHPPWLAILSKPLLSILAAYLIMLTYMGVLVTSNYKNQLALHQSYLKTFKSDMEKRSAAIGYFFSERKYDLKYLTDSHEILDYFDNKSLEMSESYGLKLSLFLIKKLLQDTISNRLIHGRKIYERLIMIDNNGYCLVDTSAEMGGHPFFHKKFLSPGQTGPEIFVQKIDGNLGIVMAAPCFYKNKVSGELVAILNLPSSLVNFINVNNKLSVKNFELITKKGQDLCADPGGKSRQADDFIFNLFGKTLLQKYSSSTLPSIHEYSKTLLAIQPIDNAPLDLLGWIDKNDVFGSMEPWKLLAVTGIITVIILISSGIIIRVNIQNLVLKARFDETEKQHKLLAEKNRRLRNEIRRRYKAEQALEEQRTLCIRSDRLRSLGEMAAGIAHELNQPLMGVRGMAELILLGMKKLNSIPLKKIQKHAEIIMEQADRMVHIIKHVRLFAREAGNIEKSVEDLNKVVNSGISLIQAQLNSHGIVLKTELSPDPLFVFINPFSIEEVILNLLGNARDAVEEKKERCAESGFTPVIRIRTWHVNEDKKMTYLEIKDNGIGISRNISSRVFDPFFTTKAPDKGTGLGLSITKSIIEEFDGKIMFNSKEGEGSVFTINFPVYIKGKIDKNEKN